MRLGLDTLPGVYLARIDDFGKRGVAMVPGTAVVRIWGHCKAIEAEAVVARNIPEGVLAIVIVRPPRAWHRARLWILVRIWRMTNGAKRNGY